MNDERKEKIDLSAVRPGAGTVNLHGIFRGAGFDQSGAVLHGLEYEQTLYTGVYRDSKLCGTFERSGISAVHRQHLFICFCDLHIKDRSGVSSGAGAGEEGGRQRDTQNHLLRALRYQYHCGGRTV